MHLTIQLFGSFEMRRGGQTMPRPRSRTGQWLLALLLLRAGREVEREWLAGTLWPESTGSGALANLRRTLTDLRRLLQEDAHRLSAPGLHALRLDLPPEQCDLLAFDQALKRGDAASLEQAVSLYRGPLLEGCLEEWLLPEREAREQAYLQALETLADLASSPRTAAVYLRTIVQRDPARESAQRRLLSALAAAGDYAEVTRAYRNFRLYLHRESVGEPAPETTSLYQGLRAEGRRPLPPPADTPSAADASPPHFPRSMASLIGRKEEVARIAAALDAARMVTLTGAGGIGKTRLAMQVATELADGFAAGVWFADMSPLSDPSLVPRLVGEALRLRGVGGDASDTEALVEFIGGKPLLLILDNCEHLAPACAQMAEALLGSCPHLRLLVTSRQPLGLAGEHLRTVAPLAPAYAARLFVERGSEGGSGFRLTAGNAAAVAEICRRLDGIPLALEMAAARLRAMSVAQIAARLSDGFPRLTGPRQRTLPRHQTLRATMDWSYGLLSPSEQVLLRGLSVFAGGWALESAEQVCGPRPGEAPGVSEGDDDLSGVSDLLLSLVDQSLVVYTPQEDGNGRYRFLEPIRQYAAEKLRAAGEGQEIRRRHLDHFLRLAEEARLHLEGPTQARWQAALRSEHDNLRAALVSCRSDDCDPETGLSLFAALVRYWLVQGHLAEGRRHGAALLARTDAGHASKRLASALLVAGHLAIWQGDSRDAGRLYAGSLEVSRAIGDGQKAAWSLSRLGCVAFFEGDLETAQRFLEESLTLERHPGNLWVIAESLNELGAVARHQKDYDRAWRLCWEALALRRTLRDDHFIAAPLDAATRGTAVQGDHGTAAEFLREALALRRTLHDDRFIAASLDTAARIAFAQGDHGTATEFLRECLMILRELGDRTATAAVLDFAGALTLAVGRLAPPERFIRAAHLYGAAASLRETSAAQASPIEREASERRLTEVCAALGEEAFRAAWSDGAALTLTESIALALSTFVGHKPLAEDPPGRSL